MALMSEEDFRRCCLLEHGEQLNREDDVDGVLKTFLTSMRLFTKKPNATVKKYRTGSASVPRVFS